jgi:hypothetical protein
MNLDSCINQIINENKLNKIYDEIIFINKLLNFQFNNKETIIKKHLYSKNKFNFTLFDNYYSNIYIHYQFEYLKLNDIKQEIILNRQQFLKAKTILLHFQKKYYSIINKLIKIDFSKVKKHFVFKKILAILFFKKINNYKVFSKYKKFKEDFNICISQFKNKISFLTEFSLTDFNDIFSNNFIYNSDKIMTSGEKYIYNKLIDLYMHNDSLIYFYYEYVLPVKFKNNLRADFFCLIIDKNNQIKKVIIEINGDQHYTFIHFFNDIHLHQRDSIKKKFCIDNHIEIITFDYNDIYSFDNVFIKLLK